MNFFRSSSTETVPITTTPISTTKTETDKTTPNYNTRLVSNFLSKKPLLKRTNYTKNLQPHTQNIHLQTKDGNILGCYFSTPPVLDRERVIIYIHGRQTNRYHALKTFPLETFLDLSYTVLIPDLRSFGDCNLQYSRTGFNTDLSRCVSFLTEKLGNVSVTLIGHCVGAGIVLGFNSYCMQNALQSFRMVLISPVLNERDLVMRSGLFRVYSVIRKIDYDMVMSDMVHDCISLIREVSNEDVVIFHGKKDDYNRIEDGIKLANEKGCRVYRSESDDYFSILKNEEVVRKIDDFVNEKKL